MRPHENVDVLCETEDRGRIEARYCPDHIERDVAEIGCSGKCDKKLLALSCREGGHIIAMLPLRGNATIVLNSRFTFRRSECEHNRYVEYTLHDDEPGALHIRQYRKTIVHV